MANPKCAVCGKTVYPVEQVKALDQSYHKACFKCSVCKMTLNLKNYKGVKGVLFCSTHTPVDRTTVKADAVSVKHAQAAPKKTSEGLATAHKGDKKIHKEGAVAAEGEAAAAPTEQMEHLEVKEEAPAETPAEPAAEAPAETPAEPAAEAPAETPAEPAAEAPAEEAPAEPAAEAPAEEAPAEAPAEETPQ